jgi:hypothetical protein
LEEKESYGQGFEGTIDDFGEHYRVLSIFRYERFYLTLIALAGVRFPVTADGSLGQKGEALHKSVDSFRFVIIIYLQENLWHLQVIQTSEATFSPSFLFIMDEGKKNSLPRLLVWK